MAFTEETAITAVSIADIGLDVFDGGEQSATYSIQITMSNGSIRVKEGDALPHLSIAQKSGLVALMADIRVKAQALIP